MGKIYQVVVIGLRGLKTIVDLCNTDEQFRKITVKQLKEKLAQKLPGTEGEEAMRLMFADKSLDEDEALLFDYGIQHKSIIQMVMRFSGGLKRHI
uniref:Ubiquitin-like domain-containing protein n=1 Tax=Neolamprologus brichardi TaxID=32507 RepID=A0A3Q4M4I1_NEOBR